MLSPRVHNFISYAGAICCYIYFLKDRNNVISQIISNDININNYNIYHFASLLWVLHFTRRCLETIFVFNFSDKSVPIDDSITEFIYYWALASWIAYSLPVFDDASVVNMYGVGLWFFAEILNCYCHFKLAAANSNRKEKKQKRRRLVGFPLFSTVTMPHYLFEITSWMGFNVLLEWKSLPSILFMLVGAFIMTCWAIDRHESYKIKSIKHTPIFPYIDIRPPETLVKALAK